MTGDCVHHYQGGVPNVTVSWSCRSDPDHPNVLRQNDTVRHRETLKTSVVKQVKVPQDDVSSSIKHAAWPAMNLEVPPSIDLGGTSFCA